MEFDLRKHTILMTLAGSLSYGVGTDDSDVDIKGVAVPPKEYYYGFLQKFENCDSPEEINNAFMGSLHGEELALAKKNGLEGTIYEPRFWFAHAAKFNPNIMECLFVRDQDVKICTPLGELLRQNRDLFISKNARHTLTGYSANQILKMKNGKDPADPNTPRGRKLAYQVVRLMRMSKELMLTGKFNVWRGNLDADELKFIKQGGWSKDKIIDFFEREDAELTEIYNSSRCVIPHEPDRLALNTLCKKIVEASLTGNPPYAN